MRVLVTFVVLAMVTGCSGELTVNATGTREEKLASIAAVKESLPPEQSAEFQQAISILTLDSIEKAKDLEDAQALAADFESRIHGKTAAQIIAIANEVQAANEKRWGGGGDEAR